MSDPPAPDILDGVAIIGMAGRFPGARTIEEFWQNLRAGVESITFFSEAELTVAGVAPELQERPEYVPARGALQDIEQFDAAFFGYNPREADLVDPQQRLFLECAWEAMERAGYAPSGTTVPVGVYAGASMSSYLFHLAANPEVSGMLGGLPIVIGNDKDHLATRVSYKLNLTGPSVTIQTACSTSLVATVLACQGLLSYQCDLALSGGACVTVPNASGYLYEEGGIHSPDGHCRPFDALAAGAVPGSGVGVVVLKRLAEAVADGDHIHAVIRGFAINNDGSAKVGYTAPSVDGQAKVIATALAIADVDPATITAIEAHGTGTPLGDPIELAALRQVFKTDASRQHGCALGSVKSNIGHLDAAAGVAGLIKMALALEHQELPPSLHFTQPNPTLDLAGRPFYVNAELTPWPMGATPRRAGVSSFGIGGTNAHVVLEEPPARRQATAGRPAQLLVWSARTSKGLDAATAGLTEYLQGPQAANLADVASTLQIGRAAFSHRRLLVGLDTEDALRALEWRDGRRVLSAVADARDRPVAFLFPGQGTQYPNMGRELYQQEPEFRAAVDRCATLLAPHLDVDVREALFPPAGEERDAGRRLGETALTQPALFTIEYALAQLWMAWGVQPRALLGHSVGEYVAACLAGVFTLEDALALVAARGRLMQDMPPGAMLAAPLAEDELRPLLGADLSLAAVNGPRLCVASGQSLAIGALEQRLAARGVIGTRLHTSHAFHSAMVEPALAAFEERVRAVPLRPPRLPFLSNVTGVWANDQVTTPTYWTRQMRDTVRFADGLAVLLQAPGQVLLEVGPGATLSRLAEQHPAWTADHVAAHSLRPPREHQADSATMLTALGRLWLAGLPIDWTLLHRHQQRAHVVLPTYPFERQRHWVDAPTVSPVIPATASASQPGGRRDLADWFSVPSWRRMPPPRPSTAGNHGNRFLVFLDQFGLGSALAARLAARGNDVVTVTPGEAFARTGKASFELQPTNRSDYAALLAMLGRENRGPRRVVHLWGVAADARSAVDATRFERAQECGFLSVLSLSQALAAQQPTVGCDLVLVTSGGQAVQGDEALRPEAATALGACKVIPQEYPDLRWRTVDVETPAPGTAAPQRLTEQLLADLDGEVAEPVTAYRGGYRWAQTYEPMPVTDAMPAASSLRSRGVYLITGGLGAIGLTLAGHLARAVQARLVLVGRAALPEREYWSTVLVENAHEDGVRRKVQAVLDLEGLGAEVLLLAADVADREQMRSVVAKAVDRFGHLDGVIHGAGLTAPDAMRAVEATDRDLAFDHFRPKALGIVSLNEALQGQEPDFCLLLSSLSSVLGGLGMVAYAAANQFLDAYANWSWQGAGPRWTSVNWDGWRLNPAAAAGNGPTDAGISRAEGVEAFRLVLAAPAAPQVVVATGDLRRRLDRWLHLTPVRAGAPEELRTTGALHPRPPIDQAYLAPRDALERVVADLWQDLLGIQPVGVHDNFFDLGGHSLLAIQLISRLRAKFQVDVSVHRLFDSPTVSEVAEVIRTQLGLAGGDEAGIIEALGLVDQFSDDEVQALLAHAELAVQDDA